MSIVNVEKIEYVNENRNNLISEKFENLNVREERFPVINKIENSFKNNIKKWEINSWREFPISQQPHYKDSKLLETILNDIRESKQTISTVKQVNFLKEEFSDENKFILISGDCAESFDENNEETVNLKCAFLNLIGNLLYHKYGKPVLTIGRIAGQYAKPRSADYEEIEGGKLIFY